MTKQEQMRRFKYLTSPYKRGKGTNMKGISEEEWDAVKHYKFMDIKDLEWLEQYKYNDSITMCKVIGMALSHMSVDSEDVLMKMNNRYFTPLPTVEELILENEKMCKKTWLSDLGCLEDD